MVAVEEAAATEAAAIPMGMPRGTPRRQMLPLGPMVLASESLLHPLEPMCAEMNRPPRSVHQQRCFVISFTGHTCSSQDAEILNWRTFLSCRYGVLNPGPKNYRQTNAEYCAEHGLVLQGEQPLPESNQTFESVGFPHDIMDEVRAAPPLLWACCSQQRPQLVALITCSARPLSRLL